MRLPEATGKRTDKLIKGATWKPVDLVCVPADLDEQEDDEGVAEFVARTKLVRGSESAAVCLSEAISHGILDAVGFQVAEPYAVIVSTEFAGDITAQFDFDDHVIPGRHWGTRLIIDAFEGEFQAEMVGDLRDPAELLRLYVVDELLAYRDRAKHNGRARHGNILLVPVGSGESMKVLPIDQSDCFGHPSTLCDPEALAASRDRHFANDLPGVGRVVLDGGADLVDAVFHSVSSARDSILSAVEIPPDEWYDRAGIEPDMIADFLDHRLATLDELARRTHWREMASAAEGGYTLDL